MNYKEKLLAAHLLSLAADEFSNHGCNDFDLGKFMNQDEIEQFVAEWSEWNGDATEQEDRKNLIDRTILRYWMGDATVMNWLAEKLEAEVGEALQNAPAKGGEG
jgi:hypothetical protein